MVLSLNLSDELIRVTGEVIRVVRPDSQKSLFPELDRENDPSELLRHVRGMLDDGEHLYQRFRKKDGNGKVRDIAVPQGGFLDFVNQCLVPLVKSVDSHPASHGIEEGWSVERSVMTHLPVETAYTMDLSNAVPGVSVVQVFDFYYDALSSERFSFLSDGERLAVAVNLAILSTVNYPASGVRGLPVGSGLSNYLFNKTFFPTDVEIQTGCDRRGFIYSRYLDDLTITSERVVDPREFLGTHPLVERRGYKVSPTRTFIQRASEGDVYVLGQRIIGGNKLVKNSREDREANKKGRLEKSFIEGVLSSGDYSEW